MLPEGQRGSLLSSGKVLVTILVVTVLVVWGSLNLAFRHWKAGYDQRVAFGQARVVLPAGGFSEFSPEGIDPKAWSAAAARTTEMLQALTASNVLDAPGMEALGRAIEARVSRARARPESAPEELAGLWDEVQAGAGRILEKHHPRPEILRKMSQPPAPRS